MGRDRAARCGRQRRDGQPVPRTGPRASCFLARRNALAAPEHRWSKYFGQAWFRRRSVALGWDVLSNWTNNACRYSGSQKSWPMLPCIPYGSRGHDFLWPTVQYWSFGQKFVNFLENFRKSCNAGRNRKTEVKTCRKKNSGSPEFPVTLHHQDM